MKKRFFLKKLKKIHNNKYKYKTKDFKSYKIKIQINCPIHGYFFQTPDVHLRSGCKKCGILKNKNKQLKTTKEFIRESKIIHGNLYDYSKTIYTGNKKKLIIICSVHKEFEQTAYHHLEGKGCSLCKIKSKKEILISNLLENNQIKHIRQKTFNDCINVETKRKLPFDFFIPDFNLIIEYDGQQHFKTVKFNGKISDLNSIKKRDTIKNNYCLNNNINLERIKYNENILKKINQIINKYKKLC